MNDSKIGYAHRQGLGHEKNAIQRTHTKKKILGVFESGGVYAEYSMVTLSSAERQIALKRFGDRGIDLPSDQIFLVRHSFDRLLGWGLY